MHTQMRAFLDMLKSAGIGHGTRDDGDKGTGVQVEISDITTDWQFDTRGKLVAIILCDYQP